MFRTKFGNTTCNTRVDKNGAMFWDRVLIRKKAL